MFSSVVKEANAEGSYAVKESGYAGFSLPIEVFFKNVDEPRKVKFEYDLFLQLEGPPIFNVRHEKVTFKNPSDDFKMKFIKGGGVSHLFNLNIDLACKVIIVYFLRLELYIVILELF